MAAPAFTGFSPETVSFFRELSANNNRAWFEEHRDRYEEHVKAPSLLFADTMAQRLAELAAGPAPQPSLFRIYRDIRFSKDKSPYKTHLGIYFGDPAYSKAQAPGFYFHIDGEKLLLGAGLRHFERPVLEKYREAVADEVSGARLNHIVAQLSDQGYQVWGETYKRVPRGYEPEHPRAQLLRHSSLFAGRSLPHPPQLQEPELIDFCIEHYRGLAPLQHWLVELFYG